MLWHTLDATVKGNTLQNCNRLSYNGIGSGGDAYGQIVCDGNTNISSGNYLASITNNTMLQCNSGAGDNVGINLKAGAYPSASNRCYVEQNVADVQLMAGSFTVIEPLGRCKVITASYPSASSKGQLTAESDQLFLGTQGSHYVLPSDVQKDIRIHIRAGQETINIYPSSGQTLWDVNDDSTVEVSTVQLPDTGAESFYFQSSTNKWFYI